MNAWKRSGAVLLALAFGGCAVSTVSGGGGDLPPFQLPPPRAARPPVDPAIATLTYPDPDALARDPFLMVGEDDPPPVKPVEVVEQTARKPGVHRPQPRDPAPLPPECSRASLDKVARTADATFLGSAGRTFVFEGTPYAEGEAIAGTCWVVQRIQEDRIDLRSRSGRYQTTVVFQHRPVIAFEPE